MDRDKAKNYIDIAHKAGYLIIGSENLAKYNQKIYLILIDKLAGKNCIKIANRFKDKAIIMQVENLNLLSNINSCKLLGIKNKGLSENIIKNLND